MVASWSESKKFNSVLFGRSQQHFSLIAVLQNHMEKISGVLTFQPETAGWEARTLPLCYAAPKIC